MPDDDQTDAASVSADEAVHRSGDGSAADETPANSNSERRSAPPSIDEGDPRTTDDGSGTSETD